MSMQGIKLIRVDRFIYLGSTVTDDGNLGEEVTHKVELGWKNWRMMSWVLCDRRIKV